MSNRKRSSKQKSRKRRNRRDPYSQRRHAKRRALERYGLELNRVDLRNVVEDILCKRARHLWQHSNRVSVWRVTVKDVEAIVRYDQQRRVVETFLPPNTKPDQKVRWRSEEFQEEPLEPVNSVPSPPLLAHVIE